jgi:hypothetical protein
MFAPMMQYRDGRPNDPVERRLVQHSGNPFSGLTPDELRRRMEYERNNPDEFRQGIMPVPMRAVSGPVPMRAVPMRAVGETPRLGGFSDRRPKLGNVTLVPRPEPIQVNEPFTQQPRQLGVSGDNNSAEASRQGQLGQQLQFGQVQQQPQFNQQGMQQMMQFMQQMMQMFSMMSGQGGFGGGFGGGFNQRPPMFGGGYGGGMGGGFGQGGYQQFQQPQQRPMPRYPRMQNNYSQSPFGRY